MNKRIIITGLMIFTSTLVLLSACGKKADNTSNPGGTSVTSSSTASVVSSSSVTPSEPEKPK